MRRSPWARARLALAVSALLLLATPTAGAVVPRIDTADVLRYWTGSLTATRTVHAEGPGDFVKDATERFVGQVRTIEGAASGQAVLQVTDAGIEFTQTNLETSGTCAGQVLTSHRATVAGSLLPNQQVGVWIGRPRDPLSGIPTGATILSVPDGTNLDAHYQTKSDPFCDQPGSTFADSLGPPWVGICSGTDPNHWMPLPAPVLLADQKTLQIKGTRTVNCAYPGVDETDTMQVVIDVLGTLDPPVEYPLTAKLGAIGSGKGTIVGGTIKCGVGGVVCSQLYQKGATAVLAALPSTTSRLSRWEGCDVVVGQQCRVAMTRARSVRAWFIYDFAGQAAEPSIDLFDAARKAEIAQNGADGAHDGAIGCGLSAAALAGLAVTGPVVVVGAEAGSLVDQIGGQLIEETLGNCLQGTLDTITNGVLLEIDPPDPNWRKAAFAERITRATVRGCKLPRNCKKVLAARRRLVDASTRVTELQEALAVAANRFGNASGAADKRGRLLHRASMRALSGMLADATTLRDRRGRELAKQLRAGRVRSIVIPKAAAVKALGRRARGTPKAAVNRLLRKRLVVSAAAVHTAIGTQIAGVTPQRVDLLAELRSRTATGAMRRTAGALTVADLALLLDTFHADRRTKTAVRLRHEALMAKVLTCTAAAPTHLRALAKDVAAKTGIGGEPGRLLAYVARKLAAKGRPTGPACR